MANATGYSELLRGDMVGAVLTLYNQALANTTLGILFIVFQATVYIKTKNTTIMWVMGLFFGALYFSSIWLTDISKLIIFSILIMESAGILYYLMFK